MKDYQFDDNGKTRTVIARSQRTADRRILGFLRGELDIDGKTILAKKRKPQGRPMNPDRKAMAKGLCKPGEED